MFGLSPAAPPTDEKADSDARRVQLTWEGSNGQGHGPWASRSVGSHRFLSWQVNFDVIRRRGAPIASDTNLPGQKSLTSQVNGTWTAPSQQAARGSIGVGPLGGTLQPDARAPSRA